MKGRVSKPPVWIIVALSLFVVGESVAVVFELPTWVKAVVVALAGLAGLAPKLLADRRERALEQARREETLGEHLRFWSRDGSPPRVLEVDPWEVGVIRSSLAAEHDLDSYLSRDCDRDLADALGEERFVLIVGDSGAGKSRAAFEAARRAFPDRGFVMPERAQSLREVLALAEAPNLAGAIVWLDDLERYLGPEGLSHNVLDVLARHEPPAVVVATMRSAEYERLEGDRQASRNLREIVERARLIRLGTFLSAAELEALQGRGTDAEVVDAIAREGLGPYIVSGPRLLDRLRNGAASCPEGVAVARAALDWRRAGAFEEIPEPALRALFELCLPKHLDADDARFERGLEWAREPLAGATGLIKLSERAPVRRFVGLDYLVDKLEAEGPAVSPAFRAGVVARVEAGEAYSVALAADAAGDREITAAGFQRALDTGEVAGAFGLAVIEHEEGDAGAAERHYREALDGGVIEAATNLGLLLIERGDEEEAERWHRYGAEAGDATAAINLGETYRKRGELQEAEAWLGIGIKQGHPGAHMNLGLLRSSQGDYLAASHHLRIAADAGIASAMTALGLILSLQLDDEEEGERWLQRAARLGEATAALAMAQRATDRSEKDEALPWWRLAAEGGELEGEVGYGEALAARREDREAERWLRSAAERGDPQAAFRLAFLIRDSDGDAAEMEGWWKASADADHAMASFMYGTICGEKGDVAAATHYLTQAHEGGISQGMAQLGALLEGGGDRSGAAEAFAKAAAADHHEAAFELGRLYAEDERLAEAEPYWRQAAESGSAEASYFLGLALSERGDQEANLWIERAALGGHERAAELLSSAADDISS
jgi:TPR repeat protein